MRPPERLPVYLDCDTGIDDALTIAYLLSQPQVDLVGIGSVSGNVSAEVGARNTLDLLALAGRPEVPVAIGAHDPIAAPFHGGAPHVHGANGVGGVVLPSSGLRPVHESAAGMLSRLAREHPHALQVIAVGPLTNLAIALADDPDLAGLVAGVTVMGGAAMVPGNVTAVAEANIHNDAEGALQVLAAEWPVTMVGLDVTMTATFEEAHREALAAAPGELQQALAAMLAAYSAFYTPIFGRACCAMHDPLAAAVAIGTVVPTLAPVVALTVDDTSGPGRGQTIADLRGRHVGYPASPFARHRVVLQVPPGFPDALLAALLR